MRARSRSDLLFGRLPPGLLMSCSDARRPAAARHSVVNPAGPSTVWWQLSADHHLIPAILKGKGLLPGSDRQGTSFPPPAFCECRHRGLTSRRVAGGRAAFVVPESEDPHPRRTDRRRIGLIDAAEFSPSVSTS